jgi:hypothetical protein
MLLFPRNGEYPYTVWESCGTIINRKLETINLFINEKIVAVEVYKTLENKVCGLKFYCVTMIDCLRGGGKWKE